MDSPGPSRGVLGDWFLVYNLEVPNTELIFRGQLTVFLERGTSSGDECEPVKHAYNPMKCTDYTMVANTVGLGASPPFTTAGSTGDTVLNETAFNVSEIRETVNQLDLRRNRHVCALTA